MLKKYQEPYFFKYDKWQMLNTDIKVCALTFHRLEMLIPRSLEVHQEAANQTF